MPLCGDAVNELAFEAHSDGHGMSLRQKSVIESLTAPQAIAQAVERHSRNYYQV